MKTKLITIIAISAMGLMACNKGVVNQQDAEAPFVNANNASNSLAIIPATLVDGNATVETQNLLHKLQKTAVTGVLIGHQDDRLLGIDTGNVEWKYDSNHLFNSDVKYLVNEYAAISGHEFGNIEISLPYNNDGVIFTDIANTIKTIYDQGGVISIVWGCRNPVYPQFDKKAHADSISNTISHFFDGSDPNHAQYIARYQGYMDKLATFIKTLKGSDGKAIPILFRTLHEQNGGWFWWGSSQTTAFDYIKMWKYTVDYLKNTAQLHNLLYVYAPSSFASAAEYDATYPGDTYIDVMSADIYDSPNNAAGVFFSKANTMIQTMKNKAIAANKPFSVSETGLNLVPQSQYWTSTFQPIVKGKGLSYVVIWRDTRNNGIPAGTNGGDSYYCAYRGQISANSFRTMHQDTSLYFLTKAQAKKMYLP